MIEQNQRNTIKSVQADTETIYLTFKVSTESFSIFRQERDERDLLLKYYALSYLRDIVYDKPPTTLCSTLEKHKFDQIRPKDLFLS